MLYSFASAVILSPDKQRSTIISFSSSDGLFITSSPMSIILQILAVWMLYGIFGKVSIMAL